VLNYAALLQSAREALLRNKMRGILTVPGITIGDRGNDLCVAIGKARQAPGVPRHDLCPVYLRERMIRLVNRHQLSCVCRLVCGGTWSCSAHLEFRGLHTCNDNRPTRNARINFIEFQEKM
jgi:hypothetical protein